MRITKDIRFKKSEVMMLNNSKSWRNGVKSVQYLLKIILPHFTEVTRV